MKLRLVLVAALASLSLPGSVLAFPPLGDIDSLAQLLAPESGLNDDPASAAIFAAAKIMNDRGIEDYRRGLQSHAESDFTRALALAPGAWVLYSNRATAYARRANYGAALKDLEAAMQLSPRNAGLLARRSEIYASTRKYSQARSDIDRAVELAPANAGILAQRAMLKLHLGERADAELDLARARAIDPAENGVRLVDIELAKTRVDAKPCASSVVWVPCSWNTPGAFAADRAFTDFMRDRQAAAVALESAMKKINQPNTTGSN